MSPFRIASSRKDPLAYVVGFAALFIAFYGIVLYGFETSLTNPPTVQTSKTTSRLVCEMQGVVSFESNLSERIEFRTGGDWLFFGSGEPEIYKQQYGELCKVSP